MFVPHRKHTPPLPVNGDSFDFVYVDDVRTSQEAYVSTACYGDTFTFLYVGDVRTSQETSTSTARYGDRFTFVYVMYLPHSKPPNTPVGPHDLSL
jgi:hypothetical protein